MINTTDSLSRGRPAPSPGREDRPGHTINTSRVVEEDLEYIDDPDPEPAQEITARDYHAVREEDGIYRAVPVRSFVVYDDGSLYAVGADGKDLESTVDEVEGFVGIVHGEAVGSMSSEELEELLETTKVEEEG